MHTPVRIIDIANKLDLNLSTVSKALNNKPGVSDKTRALVIKTAEQLGYRPNDIARGLASNSTNTIGVIIPEIINPIFGEITTGIIETANKSDFDVFLCISNWDEKQKGDNIQTLQQKRVDGIIIENFDSENQKLLEDANVPVVVFESYSDRHNFSSVNNDNKEGGAIAARHLLECGYRKTACLHGPASSSAAIQRQIGFRQAYLESGLSYKEDLIYPGEYNIDSGYRLAVRVFNEHPDIDSIFAGNDVMAFGILRYMNENNIRPGKDCGLIGFDNINMAGMPQFKLTTIKQPKYSIGRIMTNVLIDEISCKKEGHSHYPQRVLLKPELIVRETTCKL